MNIPVSYGPPRSKQTSAIAILGSAMLTIMLIAQLYGFEDFASILSVVTSVNDASILALLAGGLIFVELFALPYLLGMYISRLLRVISALLAFGVAGFWLFACFTNAHAYNSAMFSSSIELPGGLLAALWAMSLFGFVSYVIFADSRFRHYAS